MTIGKVSGIILGTTGALVLLVFNRNFNFGSATLLGDIYTLINSISWACFMVFSKPLMEKYNVITVMKWVFLFGLIYFLPFGFNGAFNTEFQHFSRSHWVALSFVVIGTTFFAYLLNAFALKKLSSTTVASYIFIQPFLAGFIAIYLGKDELYMKKIFAGGFIILGVWLISRKEKKLN
jgi:drug/metabolite transporter (DMT)-like permease